MEDYVLSHKSTPPKYIEVQAAGGGDKQLVPNKGYVSWTRSDQLLLSWLFSTIGQSVIGQVIDCENSRKVWGTLEQLFSEQSLSKVL